MKRLLFSSTWIGLAMLAGSASGTDIDWNKSGTNDWHTSANWSTDSVPGAGDNAQIRNGGTAKISTGDANVYQVEIGRGAAANNNGGLILDNHTLTIVNLFRMGYNGGNGTYVQSGAGSKLDAGNKNLQIANNAPSDCTFTLNAGSVTNVLDIRCGENDRGTVVINGGSIYAARTLMGMSAEAAGRFTINGGVVTNSGNVFVGVSGNGTLNITGGILMDNDITAGDQAVGTGTVTITGGKIQSKRHLYLGNNGSGTLNMDGGEITGNSVFLGELAGSTGYCSLSNGLIDCEQIVVGKSGTGYYTQSGGTNTFSWAGTVGYNAGSTGIVTITGGLFDPPNWNIGLASNSYGKVTLDGGKITGAACYIGKKGVGVYIQNGGTNIIGADSTVGSDSGSVGYLTINGGVLSSADHHLHISYAANSLGYFNLNGGLADFGAAHQHSLWICAEAGSTGICTQTGGILNGQIVLGGHGHAEYTISGGSITNSRILVALNTDSTGTLTIEGSDANIHLSSELLANFGQEAKLVFVLDGDPGGISTINCASANLADSHATVEWKLGDDFRGLKNQEYTLIQTTTGIISTNGCNFVDSTAGGNFELTLSDDSKRLYLTQKSGYPTVGTYIIIR